VDLIGPSHTFRALPDSRLPGNRPPVKGRYNKPTALDWSSDHNRTYRLFDWLNANQPERDIVFGVPKKGHHDPFSKSRKECFMEAAHYVFTVEDDPVIHREVSRDATRVATSIGGRLDQ